MAQTSGPPSAADDASDRTLRRYRWMATSLLAIAAAVFVLAHQVPSPSLAIQFVEAAAEAALVGGLADWFAVTAIFRRPLGLPIPHTAVIPTNKDRIGMGLAGFIERNFLDPDLIGIKIRSLDPGTRCAEWLCNPVNAHLLADRMAAVLPYVIERIEDRKVRTLIHWALRRQLDAFEPAPVLGKLLELLRRSDQHNELLNQLLAALRDLLRQHEPVIYEAVEERSRWWVPRRVDRSVAEAIARGMADLLDDLSHPDHEVRHAYERWLDGLTTDLKTSPTMRAKLRDGLREAVGRRETRAYAATLWGEIRALILSDLGAPNSVVRAGLATALQNVGRGLLQDPELRERLNVRAEEATRAFVVPWRAEIGRFVADVVSSWDASSIAERMERAVGRDLQYIRINGTLVGAAVGCIIFALTHLL